MSSASRRFRRQQPPAARLIPVPQMAAGPAPTLAELRDEGEVLFARRAEIAAEARRRPGEIAELDQMLAAESEVSARLPAFGAAHDMTNLRGGPSAATAAVVLGVTIAMLRGVEARCSHVDWPPDPAGTPMTVALTTRSAVCAPPPCIAAAQRRWHDDHVCELCERETETFTPFVIPIGPCVVALELCNECVEFVDGPAR